MMEIAAAIVSIGFSLLVAWSSYMIGRNRALCKVFESLGEALDNTTPSEGSVKMAQEINKSLYKRGLMRKKL